VVCGSSKFAYQPVLWDQLVKEWQLAPEEIEYIDRQQGFRCVDCRSNLRSMALAFAVMRAFRFSGIFHEFVAWPQIQHLDVLEINEAGSLTPLLSRLPKHRLLSYPEIDMVDLGFPENSFDLVLHSDTIEHVERPVTALAECRRVLRSGGVLCFTAPIIVGRMTRERGGLPRCYHGSASSVSEDLLVRTEFGCDIWTHVIRAGFTACSIVALEYPAGLAICAWNGGGT
jgi:SAM-dependent methyltransferase